MTKVCTFAGTRKKATSIRQWNWRFENEIDRFSLAIDVIDRVPRLQEIGVHAKEKFRNKKIECRNYALHEHGIDGARKVASRTWPY